MLSTLCLALCLALPAPAPGSVRLSPDGALVARIELERGRALLVKDSGVVAVKRHFGVQLVPGPGHLELAPAARAVVRWPGLASLTLVGPTSVSWQELESGDLLWRFSALHRAKVEVRARGARLELPDAWRVELDRGAYSFRGLPGGGVELDHLAGAPLRASWIGGEGFVSPPILVGPGQHADLEGSPRVEPPSDATATTARWTGTRWPWGRGAIPDVPDLTGSPGDPWNPGSWPWGPDPSSLAPWERWDWPWPESPAPPEAPPRRAAPPPEPEPVPEPLSSPLWRGLPENLLESHPGYRLECSERWIREELPSGRLRLQLDPDASKPRWFLGQELDLRLFPGSAVVLEQDGRLRYHEGWVRILVAVEGRDWTIDSRP